MVALKRFRTREARDARSEKQERRGGIETFPSTALTSQTEREAGTPWWH